ncbi:MAG: glutamate--tRNA ligase [Deltaproteobacteria bacterium]|jgi:glutamyl-tRNA synthetase|nr:glutamate--tRNA ligase [Deltaproteobacteria bacterium]
MTTPLKTRFAPSPTGHLHVGGARTALFNYLLARRHGGVFSLRVEDTDALRSRPEFTEDILSSLKWLGLEWDGPLVYQTQRAEIYRAYVERLLSQGRAYHCHCDPERLAESRARALANKDKPRYDGRCRDLGLGPAPGSVIRFKSPQSGETAWPDLVKGPISFQNDELDDLVIARADGLPTYNMAVVVDDASLGITHVIRGDDHVNNTPRQILIYEALEEPLPLFGHVPMILGGDKKRLSKRHGATSVLAYREMGYLPEALVNYLARLGWSHGDQEIFSLEELISFFDLKDVGVSAAVFNTDKLDWLNSHYAKEIPLPRLASSLAPFLEKLGAENLDPSLLEKAALSVRERGKTLAEMAQKALFYFLPYPPLNPQEADKLLTPAGKEILRAFREPLGRTPADNAEFDALLTRLASERNVKKNAVAQPLRLALTGETKSPGLFEVIEALGPEKTIARIDKALARPESRDAT